MNGLLLGIDLLLNVHKNWHNCASLSHCALASCGAVYCNRSCLCVCDSGWAGGVRTLLQPARSVCVSLSAFFIYFVVFSGNTINGDGNLNDDKVDKV